jgi:hypothetical protein
LLTDRANRRFKERPMVTDDRDHHLRAPVRISRGEGLQAWREGGGPTLIANRQSSAPFLPLIPATPERDWLEATRDRFANGCLPLLLANQAGWFLLNSHSLLVTWDGGDGPEALRLVWQGEPPYPAGTYVGHGILTWRLPYLFRTPPGWNLLVRGPANWPKDGIAPLEGLVEADREVAPFAMSWKLTAIETPVRFELGEPICMLLPQRRGELEGFAPQLRDSASEPAPAARRTWTERRTRFPVDLRTADSAAVEHQTGLKLRPFVEADTTRPPPGTTEGAG